MSIFSGFFITREKNSRSQVEENVNGTVKPAPFVRSRISGSYLGGEYYSCMLDRLTFAQKSIFTGKYIYNNEYEEKEGMFASRLNARRCFEDFAEAYRAFCDLDSWGDDKWQQHLGACRDLVVLFNLQYSSNPWTREHNFAEDYPKFFAVVKRMLCYNINILIKADLYRQVSLFSKCIDLLAEVYFNTPFERELRYEILFRACNNIRFPFMIYDVDELSKYIGTPDRPEHLDWFFYIPANFTLSRNIICRTAQGDGSSALPTRWHSMRGSGE